MMIDLFFVCCYFKNLKVPKIRFLLCYEPKNLFVIFKNELLKIPQLVCAFMDQPGVFYDIIEDW